MCAWIALLGGTFGLHRFYLNGWRDLQAWLYAAPTLLGLAGVQRMRAFGQDDRVAWLLIPVLGLMISLAMLMAIVYGLTSDEKWAARYNPAVPMRATGWTPVLGAALALFLGAGVLMGTVAFSIQHFFEWQLQASTQ